MSTIFATSSNSCRSYYICDHPLHHRKKKIKKKKRVQICINTVVMLQILKFITKKKRLKCIIAIIKKYIYFYLTFDKNCVFSHSRSFFLNNYNNAVFVSKQKLRTFSIIFNSHEENVLHELTQQKTIHMFQDFRKRLRHI